MPFATMAAFLFEALSKFQFEIHMFFLQGFYYDAFYGELGLNDDHFKKIDAAALKAVAVLFHPLSQHCRVVVLAL